MAPRPRWGWLVAVAAVIAATALLGGQARAGNPTKSEETTVGPLSVSSIKSVFLPKKLATEYSVDVTDLSKGTQGQEVWQLDLELVDTAGAEPPGNPDSHAAVDTTCDNSILPGGTSHDSMLFFPIETAVAKSTIWPNVGDTFIWYHGDKGAYLPSQYGCDHSKMGPSGHQGVVSLYILSKDGKWSCNASVSGTNLEITPAYSPAPICRNALRMRLNTIAQTLDHEIDSERTAATLVGSDNSKAKADLTFGGLTLGSLATRAKADDVPSGTVDELSGAAKLDNDAAAQDLTTAAGRQKALDDIAAALALKKKAKPVLAKLVAAQPLK